MATQHRTFGIATRPAFVLCSMWLVSSGCSETAIEQAEGAKDAVTGRLELKVEVGDEVALGRVGSVISDEEGNMYVADVLANEIVVLDADGIRTATIGGAGDGPGEFRGLSPTLAWSGNSLLAFDSRKRGFTMFSQAGNFLESFGSNALSDLVPGEASLFTGTGTAFARMKVRSSQMPLMTFPPNPAGGISMMAAPQFEVRYAAFGPDGTVSFLPSIPDSVPSIQSVDCAWADGSRIEILQVPYANWGPLVAFTSSGEVAVASRSSFGVTYFDSGSGTIVRELRRTVSPLPVSDEAWEAHPSILWLRSVELESGGPLVLPSDMSSPCPLEGDRPDHYPAVRSIVIDEDDRLWAEIPSDDGFEMRIFSSDGNELGVFKMPERDVSVAPFVRDDLLYVVTKDSLDVQRVQVYEVFLKN